MPIEHIRVAAVSDEGDIVVVWGRSEHTPESSDPIGFAFPTKGAHTDIELAEKASRLAQGSTAVIEYASLAGDWKTARGLSVT